MFEAKFEVPVLGEVLDATGALVDEAVLHISEDGLMVRVVDKANVGMAHVVVPADDFESFETDGERLGVDIGRLSDVLGMADSDEFVGFELDEETRKLSIRASDFEYTMGLLDPSTIQGMDDVPDLQFAAIATVATPELSRAIDASEMVSDHVEFEVDNGEFAIRADGDSDNVDYGPSDMKIDGDGDDAPSDASAKFSLNYLKDVTKTVQSPYVRIGVADEMPLRMEFSLDNSDGDGSFFIAPRIDSS